MKQQSSVLIVNKARLAVLYGKSLTTIDAWIRRGMPYIKRGDKSCEWQFDTAAVFDWREQRLAQYASQHAQRSELDELITRKMKIRTALLELKLQKKLNST